MISRFVGSSPTSGPVLKSAKPAWDSLSPPLCPTLLTLSLKINKLRNFYIYKKKPWGTWVAQSVKRLTLDFGSGHNLTVHEFEPRVGL